MNNLSSFSVADRCPFIVSTAHVASACGHLLMELFVSCWGGQRIPCINCNAHLHAAFDQRKKIRYALARQMLIWNLMVVGALIGTVAVGAVFQWVGNLAGNMVLVAGFFLVWAFKVTCVGHKIFDVRLEEV